MFCTRLALSEYKVLSGSGTVTYTAPGFAKPQLNQCKWTDWENFFAASRSRRMTPGERSKHVRKPAPTFAQLFFGSVTDQGTSQVESGPLKHV